MRLALAVLTGLVPALVGAEPSIVHLVCAPDRPVLCAAIAESLGRAGGREVAVFDKPDAVRDAGHLSVHFVMESTGPTHLTGRLRWKRSDGTAGAGPAVELSVTDVTLSTAVLGDYGAALVAESAPPL